jgi:hypothetical protein
MNLNTITEVKHPTSADDIRQWRNGYPHVRQLELGHYRCCSIAGLC